MGSGDYQDRENTVFVQGLFEESSTQKHRLGTIRRTDDGRIFRYASFTAAGVTAGALVSKATAPVDGTIAAADAALAIAGANEISLTIAGVTLNQFRDGFLVVKAGTNIGAMYKVRGNGATDGIASGRASFSLYDKIHTTWVAASSTIGAYANPYSSLLINPAVANEAATTQELAMGVTVRAVTASYYAWIQTHGICSLVLDIAAAAGAEANEMLISPGVTAGRGAITADTALLGAQIIGYAFESADLTTAEGNLVFLTIE
uniref:Uncharacterized protein n=1 Tax=viral metagenome TaxID=1070528 RepID=A0A6M3KAH9_9ZZZZ